MSNNIDNRIVNMQFNNKQFEANAQESIKTLDTLDNRLELKGAISGLSNLRSITGRFSFGGLGTSIDTIASRFSTLGIIGVTALQNITNSALNTGKQVLSSLTIDPIKTGLTEYETKMNAITTILTNTAKQGTTLEDVNASLARLNEYADLTIYNFAEMTRNIGTFTAAGVDLETSERAIKGVANLAAGSGSSAQQAANAMYQLSQAIGSGVVNLQDWNSVVNAGLGGQLFQDELIKQAELAGTLPTTWVDQFRKGERTFRGIVSEAVITSDVLVAALDSFSSNQALVDAATQVKTFSQLLDVMAESVQSGWAVSWEQIIGNREQAIETLTVVSDAFSNLVGPAADARNEMLEFWNVEGGRDDIFAALSNTASIIVQIQKALEGGFREIFPALTGQRLVEISENLLQLTENFSKAEDSLDEIQRTSAGFFAAIDIGFEAVKALAGGVATLAQELGIFDADILGTTASIGDWLVALRDSIKEGDVFVEWVDTGIAKMLDFGDEIAEMAKKAKDSITGFLDSIDLFNDVDLSGIDTLGEKFKVRFEPFSTIGKILATGMGVLVAGLETTAPIFFGLAETVYDAFTVLGSSLLGGIEDLEFDTALDIINSGLLVGIGLGLKTFVDSLSEITESGSGILGSITGILDGVKGSLEAYQSSLKANTLLKIAGAMGILTAAIVALSLIDSEKLTIALGAVTVLLTEMFGAMAAFNAITGAKSFTSIGQVSLGMVAVATAVLILANALEVMADINWFDLSKGLGTIGGLLIELGVFMRAADFSGLGIRAGIGLIALSTAIVILASAVKKFSELNVAEIAKGLASVGLILAEVALFTKLTAGAKGVVATGIGLTILATSMLIFAKAVGEMGNLQWDVIGRGLTVMAGVLILITGALALMPPNIIATGLGLLVVATALRSLAVALDNMGGMSWGEIARGLTVLAGSLAIIAGAMYLMTAALPGAAALLVVAGALRLLAPVLQDFGEMSWSEIGKGLLTMAGALAVIGIAGLALAPVIPAILGLGAGVALLGVGLLAAGTGLLVFSSALAALAISGTAGATALVLIVTSLLSLIPLAFKMVGEGIIAFATVLKEGIPALKDAAGALIGGILDVIVENIPRIVEGIFELLSELLKTIVDYAPELAEAGQELMLAFLDSIANRIGDVVSTSIKIVSEFLRGIADQLPDVIDAGFELMISFIDGLSDAIDKNTPALVEAIEDLFMSLRDAALYILLSSVTDFEEHGEFAMDGLREGFENLKEEVIDEVKDVVSGVIGALGNIAGDFTQAGKDAVNGFIDGLKSFAGDVADAAKDLGSNAMDALDKRLDINSPSKETRKSGRWFDEGLAQGILRFMGLVSDASTEVGDEAMDSLMRAMDGVSDAVDAEVDSSPVITPVLDLSDISDKNKLLKELLMTDDTVDTSVSIAGDIATRTNQNQSSTTDSLVNKLIRKLDDLGLDTSSIQNYFQFAEGALVVREDADIDLIAAKLYRMQVATERG